MTYTRGHKATRGELSAADMSPQSTLRPSNHKGTKTQINFVSLCLCGLVFRRVRLFHTLRKQIDSLLFISYVRAVAPKRGRSKQTVHVGFRAMNETPIKHAVHHRFVRIARMEIAKNDFASRQQCFVNVVQKLDHKLVAEIVDQSDAVDQILVAKIDSFFFRYEVNEIRVDQSHLLLQSSLISPLSRERQRLKIDVNQRRR